MTTLSAKTVLVTGGAGFIGHHLTRRVCAAGARAIVVDNFSTTRLRPSSFDHVGGSLRCQVADVTDPEWVKGWRSAHWIGEVQEIYHLACPASPLHYQRTPVETLKTALVGTVNVLEIARALRCRVVIASTSEVYGDPQVHPQPESYLGNVSPIGARACYDEGKRGAEAAAYAYWEQHGVDVRVARIFNTYGPGMAADDGRLIPNFIRQALAGDDLTIYGSGEQTRSFCYVDDTVEALVRIMGAARTPFVPVFNVGNPGERTVESVASDVLRAAGSASGIMQIAKAKDDPCRRCPDIARIKRELGWEPQVSFEDGLKRTVDWFRDNR